MGCFSFFQAGNRIPHIRNICSLQYDSGNGFGEPALAGVVVDPYVNHLQGHGKETPPTDSFCGTMLLKERKKMPSGPFHLK